MEEFTTTLYHLVDTYDYRPMKEEMFRDRVVIGIRDRALSEKLQMDKVMVYCLLMNNLKRVLALTTNFST